MAILKINLWKISAGILLALVLQMKNPLKPAFKSFILKKDTLRFATQLPHPFMYQGSKRMAIKTFVKHSSMRPLLLSHFCSTVCTYHGKDNSHTCSHVKHIHDLHSLLLLYPHRYVSSKELQMSKGASSGEALFSEPQGCDQLPALARKLATDISRDERQTSQHQKQKQGLFEVLWESSRLVELLESVAEGRLDWSIWAL